MKNKGLDASPPYSHMVDGGPEWATERHNSVTNSSHAIQGDKESRQLRDRILDQHTVLAAELARDYLRITREQDISAANHRLSNIHHQLVLGDLNLSSNQAEINQFCSSKAAQCGRLRDLFSQQRAWKRCTDLLSAYKLSPPEIQGRDHLPALNRLADEKWWKRKIRQLQARTIEKIARDIGLVQQSKSKYASQMAVDRRSYQKQETQRYLENSYLLGEDGEELNLWDVYQHTVSNPTVRRAELMTRISGFEVVADTCNDIGEFYTLTAPGHMHSSLKRGVPNPNFTGESPIEIQAYLRKTFELIRAKLGRLDIHPYGFRVAEPHHDGTPHWHFLLFIPEEKRNAVRAIFLEYALRISPEEKGAKKHRFKAISIDKSKGSAAGYIAKYIAKNIDGAFVEKDLDGGNARESARNIDAWASTWGIRQFQQIGGPSVTVWRELRRLEKAEGPIETARQAADASDWAAFCFAMGGTTTSVRNAPIKPSYETPLNISFATGEIMGAKKTPYGDTARPRIIGLKSQDTCIRTRLKQWRILNQRSGQASVVTANQTNLPSTREIKNNGWSDAERASPWTCVNNCTPVLASG